VTMMTSGLSVEIDIRSLPLGPSPETRDGGLVGQNVPLSTTEFFVAGKLTGADLRMLWCEHCRRPIGRYAGGGRQEVKCRGCNKYTSRIAL
jgi:hypothetical protein